MDGKLLCQFAECRPAHGVDSVLAEAIQRKASACGAALCRNQNLHICFHSNQSGAWLGYGPAVLLKAFWALWRNEPGPVIHCSPLRRIELCHVRTPHADTNEPFRTHGWRTAHGLSVMRPLTVP
ncbi:unnamed protein product [Lota lota]